MTAVDSFLKKFTKNILAPDYPVSHISGQDVVILAQLHCLPSTVNLFSRLLEADIGVSANRIVFVPKIYSTVDQSREELAAIGIKIIQDFAPFRLGNYDDAAKSSLIEGCRIAAEICRDLIRLKRRLRLVIVDDGGLLTEAWCAFTESSQSAQLVTRQAGTALLSNIDAISIQQTTSGINYLSNTQKFPKIDIGRSAAKRYFESRFIAEAVLNSADNLNLIRGKQIGIVGIGALGRALAETILPSVDNIFVYDNRDRDLPSGFTICSNIEELLKRSNVVFGCTGADIINFDMLNQLDCAAIDFVSCSSRDIEFRSLLRSTDGSAPPFECTTVHTRNKIHRIWNAGFPINFDRSNELESPDDIALTRALVLAGILQALRVDTAKIPSDVILLSPAAQRYIVRVWMESRGGSPERFGVSKANFDDISWWRRASQQRPSDLRTAAPRNTGALKDKAFRRLLGQLARRLFPL